MKPYFAAAALLTMLSCQQSASNSSQTATNDSSATTATTAAIVQAGPQCYTRISGKDTSYLEFETDNEVVNGQLEYRIFEKDKNQGAITGTISNNIIEAEYRFMSEGTTSVRPVIFKLENNQLFEATASSFDNQGVPVFEKDHTKLKFEGEPFVKGACK